MQLAELDPNQIRSLETSTPGETIQWAWETFNPNIAASSSFQTQSAPLLHLLSMHAPKIEVYFIDTGFHFKETLTYRDRLAKLLNLNLQIAKPDLYGKEFINKFGELYQTKPESCCSINKIFPLQQILKGKDAWISGIRRDQSPHRKDTPVISHNKFLDLEKICPMVHWSNQDVLDYIQRYKLPKHPLLEYGYRSVGCAPCTAPVGQGDDDRAGRWRGFDKIECGMQII